MTGGYFTAKKLHTINRRMFIIGAAKFVVFTFLFYFLFSNLFDFFEKYLVGRNNAR